MPDVEWGRASALIGFRTLHRAPPSASGPFVVVLILSTWGIQLCAGIAPFFADPDCLLMPSHHCISSVLHSMGVREKVAYTSTLVLPQEDANQRKNRVVPSWLCLDWCFASDWDVEKQQGCGTGSQDGKAKCLPVPFTTPWIAKLWSLSIFKCPFFVGGGAWFW